MHHDTELLKKQIKQLQGGLLCCITLIIFFILMAFKSQQEKFDIIRARGIIIEDSLGRDRVLIGAPIPASLNRVRTDTALVRKHWGRGYKDVNQFMNWYKDYSHQATGLVVLNEEGFDQVQIGDKLSDPNSGKRLFEVAGFYGITRKVGN